MIISLKKSPAFEDNEVKRIFHKEIVGKIERTFRDKAAEMYCGFLVRGLTCCTLESLSRKAKELSTDPS